MALIVLKWAALVLIYLLRRTKLILRWATTLLWRDGGKIARHLQYGRETILLDKKALLLLLLVGGEVVAVAAVVERLLLVWVLYKCHIHVLLVLLSYGGMRLVQLSRFVVVVFLCSRRIVLRRPRCSLFRRFLLCCLVGQCCSIITSRGVVVVFHYHPPLSRWERSIRRPRGRG